MDLITGIVPIILIIGVFYFLMIMLQQKKIKKHQNMLNNLTKGDETGGNTMYCYNCGKEIEDSANFCKYCGTKVGEIVKQERTEENILTEEIHTKPRAPQIRSISDAKYFGAIGTIMTMLSFIPSIGWFIVILGAILVLVAIKKISDVSNRMDIFQDYMKSFIFGIIGIIVFFVGLANILGSIFYSSFRSFSRGPIIDIHSISIGIILTIIVYLVLVILSGYFRFKCFIKTTEETGIELFAQAGKVYYIGSILVIILIGTLIAYVGLIMQIIAFFSLPNELPEKRRE